MTASNKICTFQMRDGDGNWSMCQKKAASLRGGNVCEPDICPNYQTWLMLYKTIKNIT